VCPYYAARRAVPEADVVLAPYSCLLVAETRAALGLRLEGNVIIVDEGHNLGGAAGACRSVWSWNGAGRARLGGSAYCGGRVHGLARLVCVCARKLLNFELVKWCVRGALLPLLFVLPAAVEAINGSHSAELGAAAAGAARRQLAAYFERFAPRLAPANCRHIQTLMRVAQVGGCRHVARRRVYTPELNALGREGGLRRKLAASARSCSLSL
jgi:Rad3-related DNA helicase